jgi:hypothetical protein
MSRGGKRPGAGRKKGSLSVKTQEIVAAAAAEGISPLEFMLSVLRDANQTHEERFKAAIQAAPYMHPRLNAVKHSGDEDNPIHTRTQVQQVIVDGSGEGESDPGIRAKEARTAH